MIMKEENKLRSVLTTLINLLIFYRAHVGVLLLLFKIMMPLRFILYLQASALL